MAQASYDVWTPLGRRITCRDTAEYLRVTAWVAWLIERAAARERQEAAALVGREPMTWLGTGTRTPLALRLRPPDDGRA